MDNFMCWAFFTMDIEEYTKGFEAWQKYYESGWSQNPDNPHPEGSDRQISWSRGWNANFAGLE